MASALDVAAAIIERQHEEGRTIDLRQLQSMLYLTQGAHYAMWGQAAFEDEILAGLDGPYVESVRRVYEGLDNELEV